MGQMKMKRSPPYSMTQLKIKAVLRQGKKFAALLGIQ
jgi:hypothetical protein